MEAKAKLFGHSIHQMLIVFPLGLLGMGVVFWESLTTRPMFRGKSDFHVMEAVLRGPLYPPSTFNPKVGKALDAVAQLSGAIRRLADEPNTNRRALASAFRMSARVSPGTDASESSASSTTEAMSPSEIWPSRNSARICRCWSAIDCSASTVMKLKISASDSYSRMTRAMKRW